MSAAQCTAGSPSPNVWTWHDDNNRTGWQQNETCLTAQPNQTGSVNQSNFGLLWQWKVAGRVYAQPLAVDITQKEGDCTKPPCDWIIVADDQDNLYAFNAAPSVNCPTGCTPQVWSLNLAAQVTVNTYKGQPVYCPDINNGGTQVFEACVTTDPLTGAGGPFGSTYIGIVGTPAIDTNPQYGSDPILYVVGAVCFDSVSPCGSPGTSGATAGYYLFAVDAASGTLLNSSPPTGTQISGTVSGNSPGEANACTVSQTSGQITFSPSATPNPHLQRSALLLTPNHTVYVGFADLPEYFNGWLFGYQLQYSGGNYSFSQTTEWATTPYGTGGGIWGAGAGPAVDANGYIYFSTGNGSILDVSCQTAGCQVLEEAGNSLLKLAPPTAPSTTPTIYDFYTPYDVFNFKGTKGENSDMNCTSLCLCDEDVSSGGVLLVPSPYQYNGLNVVINADKQSNIYVADQLNLGQYGGPSGGSNPNACPSTPNNLECVQTPTLPTNDMAQGYWSSPAYWYDGANYWLYYAATMNGLAYGKQYNGYGPTQVLPEALNAYQLSTATATGPPVSQTPYANSGNQSGNQNSTYPILFCDHSPTPSVSSNPNALAGSGVVWAIEENQNNDNNPEQLQGSCHYQDCAPTQTNGCGGHPTGINNSGALHAFCAAAGGTACPSAMTELYNSRPLKTQIGSVSAFPTPTVFNGQVYVGTDTSVNVFGICSTNVGNGRQCLK